MQFIGDFHIHSKYSRATSKNLDLENLYTNAQIKGITVIGTGDFTHPGWWQEIRQKLIPAEEGLFKLHPDIAQRCDTTVPKACHRPVRFMLVTEISNIYKKDGVIRKNHNLVFLPDVQTADKFRKKLDRIGNVCSDGRPILGLDAHDLLEIVLETAPQGYLIPAHIWTPWFSVLGSKSGFDTVKACFGDLTEHIFALETGLSSDPEMNWRVSQLDEFTLISNSDAHSPSKLGREANLFDTELSFTFIREAIRTADSRRFQGTLEFFPEEGKYHLDGHRNCAYRSLPVETKAAKGICPVCQKPVTLGVLYRVEALADRPPSIPAPKALPFAKLIPLESILAEIFKCGTSTKRVAQAYQRLVERFGSELDILRKVPAEDLRHSGIPLLDEAIERMRADQVSYEPGYDGEFGRVTIFSDAERATLCGQQTIFDQPPPEPIADIVPFHQTTPPQRQLEAPLLPFVFESSDAHFAKPSGPHTLNPEQQAVIDHGQGPLIITAGPGTGKTHTITKRMADLILHHGLPSRNILAVTFTNKAANEMNHRLQTMIGKSAEGIWIATFHGLCLRLLKKLPQNHSNSVIDDQARRALLADLMEQHKDQGSPIHLSVDWMLEKIICAKQLLLGPQDDLASVVEDEKRAEVQRIYQKYQTALLSQNLVDFEDLILQCVHQLESDPQFCQQWRQLFHYIFVDEFQDINHGQYRLMGLLAPRYANLCVIGDPDQAIYGFRGSDALYFRRFEVDYPQAKKISLVRNYRSTETILETAFHVIRDNWSRDDQTLCNRTHSQINGIKKVTILQAPSAKAEAVQIGRWIEQLVGGSSFHTSDFGSVDEQLVRYSYADIAVLFRTGEQGRFIDSILSRAGIPCQLANRYAWLQRGPASRLVALLRVLALQGTFADLHPLKDILHPSVSKETLFRFKAWALSKELSLSQAFTAAARVPIPEMSVAQQQRLVELIRNLQNLKQATEGLPVVQKAAYLIAQTRLSRDANKPQLSRFMELAATYPEEDHAFFTALAFNKDVDFYQEGVEKVTLLTMHASKGLEFPMVFIAGCEAGLIPYSSFGTAVVDQDEERRLFYVAVTRAKERLFLSWSAKRTICGRSFERKLSPFVASIEQRLKENWHNESNYPQRQKQLSLF